jgi:hypothetical protein
MKQILNKAEFKSNSLTGCWVANPTKHTIKQTRNIVPGAMPKASGLGRREKWEQT